jgi:hypothetical protein
LTQGINDTIGAQSKALRIIRWIIFLVGLAAVYSRSGAIPTLMMGQEDDVRSPEPMHYTRTLGPYSLDGKNFTVKLTVICYKDKPHAGECNEDDEETVKSMKIDDEAGKARFQKSFPVAFAHQVERHVVEVTRFEGREHQALEILFEKLPSHANSGESIQLFGVRDGTLQPLNPEPLDFYGALGELPAGSSQDSRRLLAGDTLPICLLTNYFYVMQPVRVNWKDFRLEPQETGEFEVAQQPPFSRKPDIEAEGYIHLYASPDKNLAASGLTVTPQSNVQVLSALFRANSPEDNSSADDTWLKISIDGKVGWILGLADYTAIGLSVAH